MNFGGITHIISNPSGHQPGWNFSLVGTVHTCMLEAREPTQSDVMGGRVAKDGKAYHGRKWGTVQAILDEAGKHAGTVKMCEMQLCSCRRLFRLNQYWQTSFTKGQLAAALKSAGCFMPETLPRKGGNRAEWPTATGYIRVERDNYPHTHKKPMYVYSLHRWEAVAMEVTA